MASEHNAGGVFAGGVVQHSGRTPKEWKNDNTTEAGVYAALFTVDAGGLAVVRELVAA